MKIGYPVMLVTPKEIYDGVYVILRPEGMKPRRVIR